MKLRRNQRLILVLSIVFMFGLSIGLLIGGIVSYANPVTAVEVVSTPTPSPSPVPTKVPESAVEKTETNKSVSRGSMDRVRYIEFTSTAYTAGYESTGKRPGDKWYGITASGKKVKEGRTIAVDPKVIPLGSEVMVQFPEPYEHLNGTYYAEDTGRLIKGNKIDLYMEDLDEALEFGVRQVKVSILERG